MAVNRKTNCFVTTRGKEMLKCQFWVISDVFFLLHAIASPSTYPCQWVGGSVSEWFRFSDFRDSYRIASTELASWFLGRNARDWGFARRSKESLTCFSGICRWHHQHPLRQKRRHRCTANIKPTWPHSRVDPISGTRSTLSCLKWEKTLSYQWPPAPPYSHTVCPCDTNIAK